MPRDRDRPICLSPQMCTIRGDITVPEQTEYYRRGDSISLRISVRRISARINSVRPAPEDPWQEIEKAGLRRRRRDHRDPRLCEPGSSFTSDRITSPPLSSSVLLSFFISLAAASGYLRVVTLQRIFFSRLHRVIMFPLRLSEDNSYWGTLLNCNIRGIKISRNIKSGGELFDGVYVNILARQNLFSTSIFRLFDCWTIILSEKMAHKIMIFVFVYRLISN